MLEINKNYFPPNEWRNFPINEGNLFPALEYSGDLNKGNIWIINFHLFTIQMPTNSLLFKPWPEYRTKSFFKLRKSRTTQTQKYFNQSSSGTSPLYLVFLKVLVVPFLHVSTVT